MKATIEMEERTYIEDQMVVCVNCITGKTEEITFRNDTVKYISETSNRNSNLLIGPGLVDLQINGINGIDFNTPSLTTEDILNVTYYLLSQGVTTFFPTVVTNSDENILKILHTIHQACISNPIVNECVGGIHLEGPFISPVEGAKGAHDEQFIKAPDWPLFSQFQEAAGGKIRIVTIAPEWAESLLFIENCKENKVVVYIGDSI